MADSRTGMSRDTEEDVLTAKSFQAFDAEFSSVCAPGSSN